MKKILSNILDIISLGLIVLAVLAVIVGFVSGFYVACADFFAAAALFWRVVAVLIWVLAGVVVLAGGWSLLWAAALYAPYYCYLSWNHYVCQLWFPQSWAAANPIASYLVVIAAIGLSTFLLWRWRDFLQA